MRVDELASCLIYAQAFIEYVCGCNQFQDFTVREIRRKIRCSLSLISVKNAKIVQP